VHVDLRKSGLRHTAKSVFSVELFVEVCAVYGVDGLKKSASWPFNLKGR
jgi:hypothetical protein